MAPMRTTAKARKNSPKTAKLEAFLQDFDSEVKTRVDQEKEKLNHLLEDVDHGYKMALYKISKPLREMPWMEQFKSESPEVANVSWLAANQQTQQPYSYLIETVRQRDTQINTLKERLSSLQDEVRQLFLWLLAAWDATIVRVSVCDGPVRSGPQRIDSDDALNHDFFWSDPIPSDLKNMLSTHNTSMFEYLAPPRRRGHMPQQQFDRVF
ncbi:hypothetical protein JOQ06_014547 [Pogonophryne albipinna]|uniref:Borealin N-terminal domain-containing protein n=1 Tax=Pogonophryne albipinna TaxID=1090488 RepID=A0AAD6F9V5_9TELE|nr:hypothetical protein JOQ06_014547 [Pogonophryne albipinna]